MIEIIPAIDIIDGKCVRLTQGDYEQKKVYCEDPLEVAKESYFMRSPLSPYLSAMCMRSSICVGSSGRMTAMSPRVTTSSPFISRSSCQ